MELKNLRDYLDKNLMRGLIRLLTSSVGASVFFVPKKDGNLWLAVTLEA
jgi:hypothetical protein